MLVTDAIAISAPRMTRDGYMVIDARIARTGIQIYRGSEMGVTDRDEVRVYRPDAEVFSGDAMMSFAHRPVTDDHPAEMVSSRNWRDIAVGMTGDEIVRDGQFVRVPFTLMDQAAIDAVQAGKRELSAGYTCQIAFDAGSTPDGEAYDAVMTQIRGNHLAIVDRGRAGHECRIGDAWPSIQQQKGGKMPENLRTVMLDGLSIQTTDQGAQAIEKLQGQLAEATRSLNARDGQIAALSTDHNTAISAKDSEISQIKAAHDGALAAKDAEIADLKASVPDAAAMDAAIEARATVISVAKRIVGDSYDAKGRQVGEIKRDVVAKRLPTADAASKPDAWIEAAFDTITLSDAAAAPQDPLRAVIAAQPSTTVEMNASDRAHDTYRRGLEGRWKANHREAV